MIEKEKQIKHNINTCNRKKYGCIYIICNNITGKLYIGQTTQGFDKRYNRNGNGIERVYNLLNDRKNCGIHYNKHLLNSIKKYGFEAFYIEKEYKVAYSKEELDFWEKYYIKMFNTTNPKYGYNNESGGSHGSGIPSKETRVKMSEAQKGKHLSEETKKKISESNKGKMSGEKHPNYGNHKLAGENNPMYGKHHTEEAKKKISEKVKERWKNQEYRNKMEELIKERVKDPEYIRKMSEVQKGLHSAEKNPMYGKKHTEETRRKMSENHADYTGKNHPHAKKVICLNDGNIFDVGSECADHYGINKTNVYNVCNGNTKCTREGLVFKYYSDYLMSIKVEDESINK